MNLDWIVLIVILYDSREFRGYVRCEYNVTHFVLCRTFYERLNISKCTQNSIIFYYLNDFNKS